ncbi:MAG: hypothetical protein IJ341_06735 [Bacteroidales bacterium]|nr:hypothetical protein [Bacteroidales bacterium]
MIRRNCKSRKTILRVDFLDEGTTICEKYAVETLKSVIKKIGLKKVANACLINIDSILHCNNVPLITKMKDEVYEYRQHDMGDGWLIFTGTSTLVKKKQLEMLNDIFHLKMRISIV